MNLKSKSLNELVDTGDILDYKQELGLVTLYLPSGKVLNIEIAYTCQEIANLDIYLKDTNIDIAETHAPLNDICEKCGRVYCDHENKY